MAQFIQYLYEYENGKRMRNLGFMKVDTQMDKSIIQIYAKQIDEVKGILFQREDGSKYMAAWEAEAEEDTETVKMEDKSTPEKSSICQETSKEKSDMNEEEEEDVEVYIPPSTRRYEKIQRQDLSRLPRKEWRLANNSFLLHGFYNYHHLLYIEDDEKTWIGVPGIYHVKEKEAADAFGFTEFQRLTDMELEISEEEKNSYDDFGYWCRRVER